MSRFGSTTSPAKWLYTIMAFIIAIVFATSVSLIFFFSYANSGIDKNLAALYSLIIFAIVMAAVYGFLSVSIHLGPRMRR